MMRVSRWTWLRFLIGGILLFILLERAYFATNSISYLPSLLLVGSFTAPIAFCVFLYSRAKAPDVPVVTLGLCVLWGGVLGTILAGRLEYDAWRHLGAMPTIAIGISEEIAKMIVPAYLLIRWRRTFLSEFDGIILGAASGAGFAALETMGYGLFILLATQGNVTSTVQLLLFRGLLAPAAHIAWSGLLGGATWYALHREGPHRFRRLLLTFLAVVILHALWDGLIAIWGYAILGAISLIWLIRRVYKVERERPERVRIIPSSD
jgi:RsiW-degrading membrane proteinase PrsW (M82 family)